MTTVVLFHHILGLTPGVLAFAEAIRKHNYTVITPDLFDGKTFSTMEAGFAHLESIGSELDQRAAQAVAHLAGPVVWGGFSLGAMFAQAEFQKRPDAQGALLFHAFCPPAALGNPWPKHAPAHVYATSDDPFINEGDLDAALEWQTDHENLHVHLWPGRAHLFTDSSSPEHDAAATADVLFHVLEVLAEIEGRH